MKTFWKAVASAGDDGRKIRELGLFSSKELARSALAAWRIHYFGDVCISNLDVGISEYTVFEDPVEFVLNWPDEAVFDRMLTSNQLESVTILRALNKLTPKERAALGLDRFHQPEQVTAKREE